MVIDLGALAPSEGFVVIGDAPSDYAGFSVSNAGDINGDGIDDFILSSNGNDQGGNGTGAVYVVYGKAGGLGTVDLGTPLTPAQGFKILGEAQTFEPFRSVSAAGDVNRDGFDDIIVGSSRASAGGSQRGSAWVIFGGESSGTVDLEIPLAPTRGFRINGGASADSAGGSVSDAGDVNGDGFADVIVGARDNDLGANYAGAAYVLFGKASGFGTVDLAQSLTAAQGFRIIGDADRDGLGQSVSSAGDINGDGFDDIIVGASGNESGGDSAGAAYVIFGKRTGFTTIDLGTPLTAAQGFKIQGDGTFDQTGASVSTAGDVNGDGFDDLIVGRLREGGAVGPVPGGAYVIFGKASGFGTIDLGVPLAPTQGFLIRGEENDDYAGMTVSSAGDFNSDGFDDLLIGARRNDSGGNSAGAAYVVYGKASGFGTIDLATLTSAQGIKFEGGAEFANAGNSVSNAGDINGDGADDIIIGAFAVNTGGAQAGAAYVIYGTPPPRNEVGDNNANTINGGGGNDRLFGLGGNDTINGNGGDDQLFGDDGDDIVSGNDGNDIVEGNAGNDTVSGDAGNDNVSGGAGNDIVNGGAGDDSLNGNDGNDTLNGGAGTDSVKGGIGDDVYIAADQLDAFVEFAGEGIDRVDASGATYFLDANIENLTHTGTLAIDYRGNDLANVITAGTASTANLFGYGGNDTLNGTAANDGLYGGTGNDTLNGLAGLDTIIGEEGDDTINGGAAKDNLQGGAGNDTVNGDDGNDNVNGGDGNDMLFGGAGDDSVVGGAGNDRLDGGNGDDILVGGDGIDIFTVDSFSDVVLEAAGGVNNNSDRVITALANYTLGDNIEIFQSSGTGAINIVGNASNNVFFANAASSAVFSGLGGNDTLNGSAGGDTFFGGVGIDSLNGNAGNDVLLGEDGNDTVNGGDGNDNIQGGAGADMLSGGAGTDNIIGGLDNDTLNGGDDADSLSGNEGDDIVNGDGGNDLVFGNAGADTLSGGAGDDRLAGGADNDGLSGGDGFDILNGEAGDDTLEGGAGTDRLFDSLGIDLLIGGTEADDFRFTSSANADGDAVADFEAGIDTLNFRIFDTDAGAPGVQNPDFAFIGDAAFNSDGAAKLRFANGLLEGDVDGDGAVDFTITINGDTPLPGDFLL